MLLRCRPPLAPTRPKVRHPESLLHIGRRSSSRIALAHMTDAWEVPLRLSLMQVLGYRPGGVTFLRAAQQTIASEPAPLPMRGSDRWICETQGSADHFQHCAISSVRQAHVAYMELPLLQAWPFRTMRAPWTHQNARFARVIWDLMMSV